MIQGQRVVRHVPCEPLEPQEPAQRTWEWAAAEGGLQAHWVEGPLGAEDEGGDAVLERLGRVLVLARLVRVRVRVRLRLRLRGWG